jgi:NAD dependent epimerase/dehydratase family enzyme
MRLPLGGFAAAVLSSQRMVPKRLLDAGFEFRYPTLEAALTEIFTRQLP